MPTKTRATGDRPHSHLGPEPSRHATMSRLALSLVCFLFLAVVCLANHCQDRNAGDCQYNVFQEANWCAKEHRKALEDCPVTCNRCHEAENTCTDDPAVDCDGLVKRYKNFCTNPIAKNYCPKTCDVC